MWTNFTSESGSDADSITNSDQRMVPWWRYFLPTSFFPFSRPSSSSSSTSSFTSSSRSPSPSPSSAPSVQDIPSAPPPAYESTTPPPTSNDDAQTATETLPEWARVWDWSLYSDVGAAVGVGSDAFGGAAVVRSPRREREADGMAGWMRRRASVETLPAYEEPPAYEE